MTNRNTRRSISLVVAAAGSAVAIAGLLMIRHIPVAGAIWLVCGVLAATLGLLELADLHDRLRRRRDDRRW